MYAKTLFSNFEDSLDEENHTVSGYFTDGLVDDHGHMISEKAMLNGIEEYRKWSNIRDMHGGPVGTAVEIGKKAWNFVVAKIEKDDVWKLVKAGVYKGFSVGLIVTDGEFVPVADIPEEKFISVTSAIRDYVKEMGQVFMITKLALVEISIVDRPANPRAVFAASKSGGVHQLNVLPSVLDDDSVVAIKGVYGIDRERDMKFDRNSVFVANVEASLHAGSEDEEIQEETMEKEVVIDDTEAEVEVVAEVEEVVIEEKSAEVVEEEVATADYDVVVKAISEVIEKAIAGIAVTFEKGISDLSVRIDGIEKSLSVAEVDVAEEVVVEDVEKSLSDEDVERIAEKVAEKSVDSRKSVVSSEGTGIEAKSLDIKTVDNKSLVSLIARAAVS